MPKKPTKMNKVATTKPSANNSTVANNVNEPAPTAIERLRDEFLKLNGDSTDTALLAACELLEQQAFEIWVLKQSSSHGFFRGVTLKNAIK